MVPSLGIIGGREIWIGDYPYHATLMEGGKVVCNGAIISPHYVLTTEYCANLFWVDSIRVGFANVDSPAGGKHRLDKKVKFYETYKQSDSVNRLGFNPNNIAVIRVKEPFKFDETCQPVEMFEYGEQVPVGADAKVSGWGWTHYAITERTKRLQGFTVKVVDRVACNESYKMSDVKGVHDGQICAGVDGKCVTLGDWGAPMVVGGRLAGLWSYSKTCGQPDLPSIYTDVSFYRRWIDRYAVDLLEFLKSRKNNKSHDHVEL